MKGKNLRICIVGLGSYPLLAGGDYTRVIGPSIHTVLLGRELQANGFSVSFVTYDEAGPAYECIDGIEIFKTYPEKAALNPISKTLRIWGAMRRAGADIYYHHGGAAGTVPLFCRVAGGKSVWHIAHDYHVMKGLKNFGTLGRLAVWLDIRLADYIVAQSGFQQTMLKKNFGRESRVINNHFPLSPAGMPVKSEPPLVIWVGAMALTKNPQLFLDIARALPEVRFQMIGGASNPVELYDKVKAGAAVIDNLEFKGVVPFNEIDAYYADAALLVNTAEGEGFPYAFIQSWMHYTPVVSLNSDPDGIIRRYDMGRHSQTFEGMVADIRALLENTELRRRMGENGRRYVEEQHDIKKIVRQHIEVFNELLKTGE